MATQRMIKAIREGDLTTVKQLFQPTGTDENSAKDNSLLYFSSIQAQYKVTEYFLEQGCDPNGTYGEYKTLPLTAASAAYDKKGVLGICKLLIERGAGLDKTSFGGRTPLHSAAQTAAPEIVKYFLVQGASPNNIDNEGNSPLLGVMQYRTRNYRELFAINEESKNIIKLLLDHGADPTLSNHDQKNLESFLSEHEQHAESFSSETKEDIETVREIRQYCDEARQDRLNQM